MESEEWYETGYEGLTVTRSGKFKWHGKERLPVCCNKKATNSCYGFRLRISGVQHYVNAAVIMYRVFVGEYDKKTEWIRYKDGNRSNFAVENIYKVTLADLRDDYKAKRHERWVREYKELRAVRLKFLEGEEWRLSEYEGLYVSRDGRFFRKNRFLKPYQKSSCGKKYENSSLYITYQRVDSKRITLNAGELVYKTWIGEISNGLYVMYKDGNKNNINADNLFLCDYYNYWKIQSSNLKGSKPITKEDYIEDLRLRHTEIHLAIDYALTDDMTAYNKYVNESIIPFALDFCRRRFGLCENSANAVIGPILSNLYNELMNRSTIFVKYYVKKHLNLKMKGLRPSLRWKRKERPTLSTSDIKTIAVGQLHLDCEEKYKDI